MLKINSAFLIPALFLAVLIILPCCGEEDRAVKVPQNVPLKSIIPTPRNWSSEGMTESFKIAGELGSVISLPDPVDWFDAKGYPVTQSKAFKEAQWHRPLLEQNNLQVFIQMDPYRNRGGAIPDLPDTVNSRSFADPIIRKAFIADALQRVQLYKPKYICLAMEINAYYENHPDDFPNFISLFKETRKKIKKIQPDAMVFVSFQYEQFLGKFGGQGHLPKHPPHWILFKMFEPEADAIGISSYPMKSFVPTRFGSPAQIPAEYYNQMRKHTSKPIVFTELGWPVDPEFGGSPQSQAEFLRRLPELTSDLDLRLVNWFFLFDNKGHGKVFDSMGIIDSKGQKKPGFSAWQNLWNQNERNSINSPGGGSL